VSRSSPLLARADELRVLEEALTRSETGLSGRVLIAGEAGIGKTRLLEALAEMGRERSFRVAWGRAWEGNEAPAFWLWREVLSGLGESTTMLHEALAIPPPQEATHSAGNGFERARMFEATRAFIAGAAHRAPVLILRLPEVASERHGVRRGHERVKVGTSTRRPTR
jgi:hypothetical protein